MGAGETRTDGVTSAVGTVAGGMGVDGKTWDARVDDLTTSALVTARVAWAGGGAAARPGVTGLLAALLVIGPDEGPAAGWIAGDWRGDGVAVYLPVVDDPPRPFLAAGAGVGGGRDRVTSRRWS
jgi:hypothetical protein